MRNLALKALLVILILVLMLTAPLCYLRVTGEKGALYVPMAIAIDKEDNTHIVWCCWPAAGGRLIDIWGEYRFGLHYRKLDKNMNVVVDDVKILDGLPLGASISVDNSQNAHIVYSKGHYVRIDSQGNIVMKKGLPLPSEWPLIVTHNNSIHFVSSCWDGVFYAKVNKNMSLIGNVTRLKLNPWAMPRYAGIAMTSNNTIYVCSSGGENITYTEIDENMNILADNEKAEVLLSTQSYHIIKDRYGGQVCIGIGAVDSNNGIHKLTRKNSELYHQKLDVNGTILTENIVMSPTLSYGTQIMIGILIAITVAIVATSITIIKRR